MSIISQGNKGGYTVARFNSAGGYIDLNNVVTTIGANTAGETVDSMTISDIKWSSDAAGLWTINRGLNTVATLSGSGHWDLQGSSTRIEAPTDITANTVVTFTGTTGTLLIKLHKASTLV